MKKHKEKGGFLMDMEHAHASPILRQLVDTDTVVTNKVKYSILQWGCAFVHFTFIFIFMYLNVIPMVIFNIVSSTLYAASTLLIMNRKYILFCYITFIEVCLHAYTATLMTGWEAGFPLYIISVTPVIFYMHFSLSESSTIRSTLTIGLFSALIFITCKIVSVLWKPLYSVDSMTAARIYIYNSVCTFAMLLYFSLVFLREMQCSHAALEEQNARLDKMAATDTLTGLYNRRSMEHFMNEAVASGRVYSCLMCDIDDFKKINDTYGHDAGDEVLRKVSAAITSGLRDKDHVCRWGGEEILILATGTDVGGAFLLGERIRKSVESLKIPDGNGGEIHCSVTIGAADSREEVMYTDVITLADHRLYLGKKNGKNMVVGN